MRCQCGFDNTSGAKFCAKCGLALGGRPTLESPPPPPTPIPRAAPAASRPSRLRSATFVLIAVIAGTGYWWQNRPPGQYKVDNGGLYPINVGGKFGFMDRTGKTVITPQFDETYGFSEGHAAVRIGTKFGYVNTKGVVTITPQFTDVRNFRYGRATVKLCCGPWQESKTDDRYGIIDEEGKYVSSPTFPWMGWYYSGGFLQVRTAAGKLAFVDRSGRAAISGTFDQVLNIGGFVDALAPAGLNGKWGYIDTTGKWTIDPQFERAFGFSEGLAGVLVGGRIGYIDRKGSFAVNPQYDLPSNGFNGFNEGYARVQTGRMVGYIDTGGRVVVEPKFFGGWDFGDGLAAVRADDDAGWGYIDRAGKMVVSPQFETADSFQGGLARVTALGKEAYITTSGAFVVDPFPGTTLLAEKARIASEAAQAAARAQEAERIAAAANQAEQSRIRDAIERQSAELRQSIANARSILVGSWKDENSRSTLEADGTLNTLWDNGTERSGEWRVLGDVLVYSYNRSRLPNGSWVNNASNSTAKIVYIDGELFRTVEGSGSIWNNRRVPRD